MFLNKGGTMSDYNKKMNEKYQSVNNLWKDIKVPFITRVEAEKAKNLLIKKFGAKRFMPPNKSAMRPRNYRVYKPYICLSGQSDQLWKGWRRLIHSLSHKVYWNRYPHRHFNHSIKQAELEFEMCQFVISSGWLEGGLKPKVVVLTKEEKRQKKLDHYQKLINRWQTKMKLATTFIRKYNKKVKYLNKQ